MLAAGRWNPSNGVARIPTGALPPVIARAHGCRSIDADGHTCSFGLMPGIDANRLELDEIWNHAWYRELRTRLFAKRFEGTCATCAFRFGSLENQAHPLRAGVHHSHEHRLHAGQGG